MTKTTPRILVLVVTLAAAVTTQGATLSGLDVTVKKDGKTVQRATTNAAGNFATAPLEPGAYNLEFRAPKGSDLKGQKLAIQVSAGNSVRQTTTVGEHMAAGVAMAMDVPKASKLTGKITDSGAAVAESARKAPPGMEQVKANVKVIGGKRHVWVPGPIGSNIGGRWVEEGTEGAALNTSNKKGGDGEVLQRIQDQSANIGRR